MIQTILFDLDGTLVDTEPAAAKAVADCFREWKVAISQDDARYITGRTWETAFEHLFSRYPVPIPREEASRTMIERYRMALQTELLPVKGSAAAVRGLAPDFKLGLVSGSHRSEIFFALDRLAIREHFQVVLGAEDYPRSKPAPDGYLKALEALGGRPKETLIFEDSEAGIASALAAGAWVVAVDGTNHFGQDTTGAHERVQDLSDIGPDWVRRFAKKLQSALSG